jgi:hypothetical protein
MVICTTSQVETDLAPAERDHQDDFKVGDEVKLTKEKVVRSRGGGIVTLDTNAKGVVIADKFGDGQVLQVDFRGVKVDVKKDMLKTASKTAAQGVDERKIVAEIKSLRDYGYSPIDVIMTARQRYGKMGESALKQAKAKGLLEWNLE